MNIENIILSGRNQLENDKHCMIPFLWNVHNGKIHKGEIIPLAAATWEEMIEKRVGGG
jgi:hypothetical protein